MTTPVCPYCKKQSQLLQGSVLFGRNCIAKSFYKRYWACVRCDAYIACHGDSRVPLGNLANRELRAKRAQVHIEFDKLWKDEQKARRMAYYWLTDKLGIDFDDAHIGMFDQELCDKALEAVRDFNKREFLDLL